MAVNYTDKGVGLVNALNAAGWHTEQTSAGRIFVRLADGAVNVPGDEAAIQAIVDAYDELPDAKAAKIAALKAEGLSRVQVVFPAVQSFDDLDLAREQYLSIAPAARQATTDFQKMIDIVQAGKAAAAVINGYTLIADVRAYDVVNTPGWPV